MHEKSQSLDIFKIYKAEVKNQQNIKTKAIRSDRVVSILADTTDQVDMQDLLSIF